MKQKIRTEMFGQVGWKACLLLRTVFLFLLLYIIFFALAIAVLFGCCYLLYSYWTTGNKYNIPTTLIIIGGIGAILLIYKIAVSFSVSSQQERPDYIEISREQDARLFQLIDEVSIYMQLPPPQHVYLSGSVSASVFFDIHVCNLFILGEKKLEIGLGLINVLNSDELKAVIAHELAHFSQRTTLLGTSVYIVGCRIKQLIRNIEIKKRGTLEDQYYQLAYWFRVLAEMLFSKLLKDYSKFSNELEFEADHIAIGYVHKKALVSALYKVSFAVNTFEVFWKSMVVLVDSDKSIRNMYEAQRQASLIILMLHGKKWEDDFIEQPLPGYPVYSLTERRISILKEYKDSAETEDCVIPAREILNAFEEECVAMMRLLHSYGILPKTSHWVSMPLYKRWFMSLLQEQQERENKKKQNIRKIVITMDKRLHYLPLTDYFFELCWDNRRLGRGWYKIGFLFEMETNIGKHQLLIKGPYIESKLLEIEVTLESFLIEIDYKYLWRKNGYHFYQKK